MSDQVYRRSAQLRACYQTIHDQAEVIKKHERRVAEAKTYLRLWADDLSEADAFGSEFVTISDVSYKIGKLRKILMEDKE